MTLDGLRVNHAALERAAADLLRTVGQIDDRMERMVSELAPLSHDWTGAAQLAYHSAKARWDGAIREMRDLLAQTGHAVDSSNAEYRAADQRGAAAFDLG